MRNFFKLITLLCCILFLNIGYANADSADEHIKNLKNPDATIRAKAAFELGCS